MHVHEAIVHMSWNALRPAFLTHSTFHRASVEICAMSAWRDGPLLTPSIVSRKSSNSLPMNPVVSRTSGTLLTRPCDGSFFLASTLRFVTLEQRVGGEMLLRRPQPENARWSSTAGAGRGSGHW